MTKRRRLLCAAVVGVSLTIPVAVHAQGWTDDGSVVRLTTASDNVGIGTASPVAKLQVTGSAIAGGEGSSSGAARVAIGAAHADYGAIGYGFVPTSTAFTYNYLSSGGTDAASMIYFYDGGFNFRVAGVGTNGNAITWSTPMVVDKNGRVGIGTLTPSSSFKVDIVGSAQVSGDLNVLGNIAAKYQDVAEWVPASEDFEVGTVVVLDETTSNQVTRTAKAYDTRVAGVVSAQPGVILGEPASNKEMIATTGRVKVKVDATQGAVKIGDLLVSSSAAGYAMVSRPVSISGAEFHRPGTIIGKALEALPNGKGEILVLLSLH